jgi:asparagine synthetase B (glutamine-hydrolysing)
MSRGGRQQQGLHSSPPAHCGVLAFFQEGSSGAPEEGAMRTLMDRMAMRGPDGQKVSRGATAAWGWSLGHQRLAIMDPVRACV